MVTHWLGREKNTISGGCGDRKLQATTFAATDTLRPLQRHSGHHLASQLNLALTLQATFVSVDSDR